MKHLFVWVLEGPVFAIIASQPTAGLVFLGIFATVMMYWNRVFSRFSPTSLEMVGKTLLLFYGMGIISRLMSIKPFVNDRSLPDINLLF